MGKGSSFHLPATLTDSDNAAAASVLQDYFRPPSGVAGGYTGGQFDRFDPVGTRSASVNTFTSDDLVAVTLLSVKVPGRAAYELLGPRRRLFEVLLEDVGPDRDFAHEASVSEDAFKPGWVLWRALEALPGVGPTTVSKLMARKRPRLFPIYDSVINQVVLGGSGILWEPLHEALRADGLALHDRLIHLRLAAGLDEAVSALRVFDVLAWMEGKDDHKDEAAGEE